MLLHAVPAVAVVIQQQAVTDGGSGRVLQGAVDGGGDVVTLVEHVAAVLGDHFLAHHFSHVRRVDLHRRLMWRGVHRHGLGGVSFGLRDELQVRHALQDVVVAALAGTLGIADRVAAGRELGDAGQRGHLVQIQLFQLLAVVVLGGSAHAVGAVAEEALVQVQLEDLVLAQLLLDLTSEQDFSHLAGVAVLGAEEKLARDLLGDGRAARNALGVGGGQQPDRAADALVIDAVVLVEAGILGGEEGLFQALGDVLHLDGIAPGLPEYRHQFPFTVIDIHGLLQLDIAQGLYVRKLGRDNVIERACGDRAHQGQGDEDGQQPAKPATETWHPEVPNCGFCGRRV
ncbi:hypothetical protein D3C71_1162500 [compost metagenome]